MATKAACAFALVISLDSSTASASVLAATSASSATSANTQHLLRKRTNAERRKLLHNNVQNSPTSTSPGRASRGGLCLDDASYRSKIGFTCKAIRQAGLNCDGFADLGFTPSETKELNLRCPNACGRCTDNVIQSLSTSTVAPTSTPTNAPSVAPTTSRPTLTKSGMGICFDDSCADDPLYVGKYNIDCEVVRSGTFDCAGFGVMNYDDDEVAELIAKCPCACNIDCIASNIPSGMPTLPPTHKQTSSAPSTHPTLHPSAEPSLAPSSSPSSFESAPPSISPTVASSSSPSAPPSLSPTVTFSSSPSTSESTLPSASPSLIPTTSHSNAPSRLPVSSVPSIDPTAAPTAAPSRMPSTLLPSTAPTLRDSDAPSGMPTSHSFESRNPSSNPTLSQFSESVKENFSSSHKDKVSSNTDGGIDNGDITTDLNHEVIDISPRSKMIEEDEAQMDTEEPNQASGSADGIGASVAIATCLVLLHATSELWRW